MFMNNEVRKILLALKSSFMKPHVAMMSMVIMRRELKLKRRYLLVCVGPQLMSGRNLMIRTLLLSHLMIKTARMKWKKMMEILHPS